DPGKRPFACRSADRSSGTRTRRAGRTPSWKSRFPAARLTAAKKKDCSSQRTSMIKRQGENPQHRDSMSNVVIVESPAKAKTINKYLGSGYQVLASFGHIRDLPSKDGSVRPDDDFSMDWEVDSDSAKRLAEIAKAVKGADRLYLATDPDREGEAISW